MRRPSSKMELWSGEILNPYHAWSLCTYPHRLKGAPLLHCRSISPSQWLGSKVYKGDWYIINQNWVRSLATARLGYSVLLLPTPPWCPNHAPVSVCEGCNEMCLSAPKKSASFIRSIIYSDSDGPRWSGYAAGSKGSGPKWSFVHLVQGSRPVWTGYLSFFPSWVANTVLDVIWNLKGGPEPSEKLIRKVLVPIGRFHSYFTPVPKQIRPYHPTWYISRTGWSVFRSTRR